MARLRGWADRAEIVLADTSVFRNFADGGALLSFLFYVDERLYVVDDVERELAWRNVKLALTTLQQRSGKVLGLPVDLLGEAASRIRASQRPGDHPRRNAGEVATALLARRLSEQGKDVLVLMDDKFGKRLLVHFGVPFETTPELIVEMTAAGRLDEESGASLFVASTPEGVGEREFRARLSSYESDRRR